MKQPLARVVALDRLEGPRGPDGAFSIHVPKKWMARGARVRVTLPGRVACAACDGGGCDRCGRSGAVSLASSSAVELTLPRGLPAARVRLPELTASDEGLPRGHVWLTVIGGAATSRGVDEIEGEGDEADHDDVDGREGDEADVDRGGERGDARADAEAGNAAEPTRERAFVVSAWTAGHTAIALALALAAAAALASLWH